MGPAAASAMSPNSTVPGAARKRRVKRLPLYTVVRATPQTATNAGSQPSRLKAWGSSQRLQGGVGGKGWGLRG